MSSLRVLPHVYMFVCVLWVDTDVGSVIAAADITQLSQCHTGCSRLTSRSHAFVEKERVNIWVVFFKGTLGKTRYDVSPPKDRCFPLRPYVGLPLFSTTILQTLSTSWFMALSFSSCSSIVRTWTPHVAYYIPNLWSFLLCQISWKTKKVVQKPSNLTESSPFCIKAALLCLNSSRSSYCSQSSGSSWGHQNILRNIFRLQISNQKGLFFYFKVSLGSSMCVMFLDWKWRLLQPEHDVAASCV